MEKINPHPPRINADKILKNFVAGKAQKLVLSVQKTNLKFSGCIKKLVFRLLLSVNIKSRATLKSRFPVQFSSLG